MKKIVHFVKHLSGRAKGGILSVFLSLCILIWLFGPVLASPNKYYFDQSGDGLLTYYYATYQLKYDSSYWHISASNYPYGESVFFSSDQPVLTAAMRFINNNLLTIEDHVPGIFNSVMLYSFCICALFIFLILYEFKVNIYYAALFAVGITFLSPQWVRILAHFPLSYAFAIPGLLYLLLRFGQAPSLKRSLGIAAFVFIMACLHAYFIGLFGIIFVVYFLFHAFRRPRFFPNLLRHCLYFAIQLLLPFLLLQLMISLSSDVSDRTTAPWGFLFYVSSFDGMFFPYGKPYQETFSKYYTAETIQQFEGLNYTGLFGILIILVFLHRKLAQLFDLRFRDFFLTGFRREVLMMVLIGILGALYACGIPYIYYENLTHYVGPLRQMRGLGRFAWLFFYAINIFAAWYFYKAVLRLNNKWIKLAFCVVPLAILYYDAYHHVKPVSDSIRNEIPALADRQNTREENKWISEINTREYQAIIPLPYFLLGSENLTQEPEHKEIFKQTYIASMKTGLPITAAVLSRTSLAQTAKNLCLITEPYRPLQILNDLPSHKPFLILSRDSEITSPMQAELLKSAALLKKTPNFNLYRLNYERLATFSDSLYSRTLNEMASMQLYETAGWKSTSPVRNFAYKSFDELACATPYRGKGAYTGKIRDYNRLFEDTIPAAADNQSFILSFWMKDLTADMRGRSTIEIAYGDSATGNMYGGWWGAAASHYRVLDGTWGLIEIYIKPAKRHDKVVVTVWNTNFIDDTPLVIDEFWIRPEFTHVYKTGPGEVCKNNRYYLKP